MPYRIVLHSLVYV